MAKIGKKLRGAVDKVGDKANELKGRAKQKIADRETHYENRLDDADYLAEASDNW